jgi:hypothetical protein
MAVFGGLVAMDRGLTYSRCDKTGSGRVSFKARVPGFRETKCLEPEACRRICSG